MCSNEDHHRLSPCYDKRITLDFTYLVLPMQNKRAWTVTVQALAFCELSSCGILGYKTAQNYYEASIDEFSATDLETYYAEVKEVNERTLTVKGLSINEEKYQGEFQYEIWGEVTIVQGSEIITLSDLEQGDIVSIILITGEGHVKGITDAFKITLIKEAE